MATTSDYLSELVEQKTALANNLVAKGVEASSNEKFNTLIPKVLDIPSGDSDIRFGDDFPILDGNTHIWIEREIEEQTDTFEFMFVLTNGEITFNWGDGTSETISTTGQQTISHVYPVGQYRIDIVATGEWKVGSGSGSPSAITTTSKILYSFVELGHNIAHIGSTSFANFIKLKKLALNLGDGHTCYYYNQIFYYTYSLEELKIYSGTLREASTTSNSNLFNYATSLRELDCSNLYITYLANTFSYDYSLAKLVGLKYITYIGGYTFRSCISLPKLLLPNTLTDIGTYAFSECSSLNTLVLTSEIVISLANVNALNSTPIANGTGYIYVPKALIEDYKVATNWSTYANQFRAIEDYLEDIVVMFPEFERDFPQFYEEVA